MIAKVQSAPDCKTNDKSLRDEDEALQGSAWMRLR
jgi:hypothetical protein